MELISRAFDFVLNRCPSCGLSAETVCVRCWLRLNPQALPKALITAETKPFHQRVLYVWNDTIEISADILRDLILSSKQKPLKNLMRHWAFEFHRRVVLEGTSGNYRGWLVIPAPGRSGVGELDHAGMLAFEIARVWGKNLIFAGDVLERVGNSTTKASQKLKSKKARGERKYQVSEKWRDTIDNAVGVLFVDDVIVTGSTAKAAWEALGRPLNFECWAIAFKEKQLDAR